MIVAADYGVSSQASDNGPALTAACAAAMGGSVVELPPEPITCTSPVYIQDGSRLRLSGPGTLIFTNQGGLVVKSAQRITVQDVRFMSDGAVPMLRTAHSAAASDPAYLTVDRCEFDGLTGTGIGILLERAICVTIRDCRFRGLAIGIQGWSDTYSNGVTVDRCTFLELTDCAILHPGESWIVSGGVFEPKPNGQTCGIRCHPTRYSWGLTILGGWFGDVRTPGGGPWIDLNVLGASITGCRMAPTLNTAAIRMRNSEGVHIAGNRIDGTPAIECIAPASWGVAVIANDAQGGLLGSAQVNGLRTIGNLGIADV